VSRLLSGYEIGEVRTALGVDVGVEVGYWVCSEVGDVGE